MPTIDITIGNLLFDVEQQVDEIARSLDSGTLRSDSMIKLCANYRKISIAVLLSEANTDAFYGSLYLSARTYVFLLKHVREYPDVDPYYLCKSRAEPFWDAVVADDMVTAREIATLATSGWKQGLEDEDDYCYFDFIMALVENPANVSLLEQKVQKFKTVMEGDTSVRFDICSALMQLNSDDFKHSLCELIDERDTNLKEEIEYESLSPEDAQTEAVVFIEGIALVKIAKLLNMAVGNQYKFIPSLAFVASSDSFSPEDPWNISEELGVKS